jgi:hypothetical protein
LIKTKTKRKDTLKKMEGEREWVGEEKERMGRRMNG